MVGFSQSKISKIENGDGDSLSDLKLLAAALEVKIEELVRAALFFYFFPMDTPAGVCITTPRPVHHRRGRGSADQYPDYPRSRSRASQFQLAVSMSPGLRLR